SQSTISSASPAVSVDAYTDTVAHPWKERCAWNSNKRLIPRSELAAVAADVRAVPDVGPLHAESIRRAVDGAAQGHRALGELDPRAGRECESRRHRHRAERQSD